MSDNSHNGCGGDDYNPPDNAATPDIIEAPIPSQEDGETDRSNSQSSNPNMVSTEPPLKRSNATKARRCIQERIDALRSATFMVDDGSVLESVKVEVESLLMQLKKSSPQENGLPLRQSPAKKKLKVTEADFHKVFHKTLPYVEDKVRREKTEVMWGNLIGQRKPCHIGTGKLVFFVFTEICVTA